MVSISLSSKAAQIIGRCVNMIDDTASLEDVFVDEFYEVESEGGEGAAEKLRAEIYNAAAKLMEG